MILSDKECATVETEMTRFINQIIELGVESVQVVITATNRDHKTRMTHGGAGNFYARLASCQSWLKHDEQDDAALSMATQLNGEQEA